MVCNHSGSVVMLIWVCALHCEAKPVIDFYRLKKSHDHRAFDVYHGDDMACVVSGIGKLASAAASAWIAASFPSETSLAWINLGVAGAAEHAIGDLFALNKVVDADSGQSYYPAPVAASSLVGSPCLTLGQPSDNYREDTLFDMEASGFIHATLRFSSAELTQSLKIISDNRQQQTGMNRQRVSELIHQHIDSIDRQAQGLFELNREIKALELAPDPEKMLGLMGNIHRQRGRLDLARASWEALLAREPNDPETLSNLGILEWQEGDTDKALEYWLKATEDSDAPAGVWLNLARAYEELGDREGARRMYEEHAARRGKLSSDPSSTE